MADIIAIILLIAVAVIGFVAGFNKVLNTMSNGIIGNILLLVACYFSFGVVLSFPFVQRLMDGLVSKMRAADSAIVDFLLLIRIDLVIFGVCLYAILMLLRMLVFKIVGSFFEQNSKPIIVANKVLGVLLALLWLIMFELILLQILAWTTGLDGGVYKWLEGSFLGLDRLFVNNPLNAIIKSVKL